MAPTIKNLQDFLLAQNPRRALQNPLPKQSAHTKASCRSQTPSLPRSEAPHRSHRSHRSCSQALVRSHSPSTDSRPPSVLPLSRSRLITLPQSSIQTNPTPTMPLARHTRTPRKLQGASTLTPSPTRDTGRLRPAARRQS